MAFNEPAAYATIVILSFLCLGLVLFASHVLQDSKQECDSCTDDDSLEISNLGYVKEIAHNGIYQEDDGWLMQH